MGIYIPALLAASRTVEPWGTLTFTPSMVKFYHIHCLFLPLLLFNSAEAAFFHAGSALNAFILVYDEGLLYSARNSAYWTYLGAQTAALHFSGLICILASFLRGPRTALFIYMRFVFVSEISQSAQNRVWSGLSQSAESCGFNIIGQLL